jgi:YegS/Rv2252/BmrU family lipid kinase
MNDKIREALIIFNPKAGRAHPGSLDRARKILSSAGIETELAPTDAAGAAVEIARRAAAAGRQMVIACGGDGTLNEVVNGLAGSQVALALLPAGTANVLAKELQLPWNIEKAAALVAGSRLRRIALGWVKTESQAGQGRYFLSVAGAGPDGAIVNAVDPDLKARTGTLAYWAAGFQQLTRYKFPRFRATSAHHSFDATLIVVGRTKNYGGPFQITTQADLYGDEFELMLCTTSNPLLFLGYLPLLWAGQLRRARHAHFFKAASVRCEPIGAEAPFFQVDGEPAGQLPAEFRIVPDALTLAVPQISGRKSS